MRTWRHVLATFAALMTLAPASAPPPEREALRRALSSAREPCPARPGMMTSFYARRDGALAWISDGGPTRPARDLVAAAQRAGEQGIDPAPYDLPGLERSLRALEKAPVTVDDIASLDVRLTRLFLAHATDVLVGRVDPATFDRECHAAHEEADLLAALEAAVSAGVPSGVLEALRPTDGAYATTMDALHRYRRMPAWASIPDGPPLSFGDVGDRVALLRLRLEQEAFSQRGDGALEAFDAALERAVVCFQESRGLTPDGIVGPVTLERLRVEPRTLASHLELALERWRWLPRFLGDPHVLVNVAGFRLQVVQGRRPVMEMRVVVGREAHRTPSFSSEITHIVFSPAWYVPRGIALRDKLPKIRKDPRYLARQGFRLYAVDGGAAPVAPESVDWSAADAASFRYRLVQSPGPRNALGGVKFSLPNAHNVYLHDTPARGDFARPRRTFSSGCIRLEGAADLAAWLLREEPGWDRGAIAAAMTAGRERRLPLRASVPVHIVHLTAWTEPDGTVHFRDDPYGRDERLLRALARATSGPGAP